LIYIVFIEEAISFSLGFLCGTITESRSVFLMLALALLSSAFWKTKCSFFY